MSKSRMPSDARKRSLELAIRKIQRGRARTKATKVSFASVAKEAGVSPALIHNHHPEIAEAIRETQGRSSRAQRDAKHAELKREQAKTAELSSTVDALHLQIAKLASINEVLLIEIRELKAKANSTNVLNMPDRR